MHNIYNPQINYDLFLPEGEGPSGKGALDIDEALVAAATKAQADISLGLDERTVNEDVEFADDVKQSGVLFYFFPRIARETPDVVAQLLLDAADEGAGAIRLLQGVSTAQGNGRLVVGDDLHQFVEGALFPTLRVPRVGIMTARATMIAARQID